MHRVTYVSDNFSTMHHQHAKKNLKEGLVKQQIFRFNLLDNRLAHQ